MSSADPKNSDAACGQESAKMRLARSTGRAAPKTMATTNGAMHPMRRLLVLLFAATAVGFTAAPMSAFATHWDDSDTPTQIEKREAVIAMEDGYVPVAQSDPMKATELRMQVEYPRDRPATGLPTILIYQGYSHKLGPPWGDAFRDWAMHNGYAVMVVSVRGAGCSGGTYDFLSQQEALDGRDVIKWITDQTVRTTTAADGTQEVKGWSNGKVALVGDSYAGLEQLPVAALQPPGLVAIAPGQPIADLYRDVAHPGGISNTLLPTLFSAEVHVDLLPEAPHESLGSLSPSNGLTDNRTECIENQAEAPSPPPGTAVELFAAHRWDDDEMKARAPGAGLAKIKVPTFTVVAWQDQTVGSRAIVDLPKVSGPFHAVLSNGGHGWPNGIWYADRARIRLQEFLDFYVRGVDNGFGARAPIEVWWESQRGPAGSDPDKVAPDKDGPRTAPVGDVLPRWTSGLSRIPPPQRTETTLFLSSGGRLSSGSGTGAPDQYTYVGGTGQYRGDAGIPTTVDPTTNEVIDWSAPPDSDKSLVYTSAPLDKDLAVLGSGSLDLWLDSTATDTDVQVVLTEVRPDGQEMYVQAGWLRASHRRLDAQRSTATLPFHTHQELDTQALTPLKPEPMRVEIRPFGHVFRAGSRLRVFIEAPPRTSGVWSFESLPGPALNRVYHDSAHPSALRLETLPGQTAPVDRAACGSIIRQPCRTNTIESP